MARYIDADNLINELSAACMPIYEKGITGILGDNSSIADIINEQPTADVQEVRRGRWECNYDRDAFYIVYVCSKCGRETLVKENFCPDCGSKMDGKDGEED